MSTETQPALYAALAKARQEFGAVVKDKTAKIASQKGAYSYTYADLASVIEATAPALAKHGLSIIQEPEVTRENGDIWLTLHGSLCHAGGEVVPFRPLTMPVGTSADARTIGTAISYARRYQLISVLNIAAEADDDDGAGSQSLPAQRTVPQRPTPPPAPPEEQFQEEEVDRYANDPAVLAKRKKANTLGASLYGQKWDDVRHANCGKLTEQRTQSIKGLTLPELDRFVDGLEKLDAKRQAAAHQQEMVQAGA